MSFGKVDHHHQDVAECDSMAVVAETIRHFKLERLPIVACLKMQMETRSERRHSHCGDVEPAVHVMSIWLDRDANERLSLGIERMNGAC